MVIGSCRCWETEKVFRRERSRKFSAADQVARRKLRMLNDAETLRDLAAVPGTRLETLRGDRQGQYSIRINDQWRICFTWRENKAEGVEIVDYH
jgi:proteic killer suppression protein